MSRISQMKASPASCYALSLSVAATLLAGCGGSQPPSTGNTWLAPIATSSNEANNVSSDLAHRSRLFVANNWDSRIVIYPAHVHNPRPIGSISSGVHRPSNLAVDQYGTLYVQNGNNTITEYREGQKVVSKTLEEPAGGSTATLLTVGSDGTVYAGKGGKVFEFAGGSTKPTKTLVVPGWSVSLALDSKNDLFVSWFVPFMNAGVAKFKPSSKVYKNVLPGVVGILAVDSHDNLLVDEGDVAIYKPGSKTPFRKIHTGGIGKYATQFAFDSDEKYLYFSALTSSTGSYIQGQVYVYDYETGKLAWTVSKGLIGSSPSGVALSPAAP